MKKIHINNDDNYATPPKLYEELNKRFNFDLYNKKIKHIGCYDINRNVSIDEIFN